MEMLVSVLRVMSVVTDKVLADVVVLDGECVDEEKVPYPFVLSLCIFSPDVDTLASAEVTSAFVLTVIVAEDVDVCPLLGVLRLGEVSAIVGAIVDAVRTVLVESLINILTCDVTVVYTWRVGSTTTEGTLVGINDGT